eukprot:34525-Eustigmatos_ZCMA.PRE.1
MGKHSVVKTSYNRVESDDNRIVDHSDAAVIHCQNAHHGLEPAPQVIELHPQCMHGTSEVLVASKTPWEGLDEMSLLRRGL